MQGLLRKTCSTFWQVIRGFFVKFALQTKPTWLKSNEDGSEKVSPTKSTILSDGALALIAGSDTTASVASSTFWSLLCHLDVLSRLRAEVDKFYPP